MSWIFNMKSKRMLRCLFAFIIGLFTFSTNAQGSNDKLKMTIIDFHKALVARNTISINKQTDKVLSYGHSNGWVETKSELLKNLESGFMRYESYVEDSIVITANENVANARFS